MGRLERIRADDEAERIARDTCDENVRFTAQPEVDDRRWEARQVDARNYEVVGKGIERMVAMTDLTNEYAVRRLQRSLDKIGVTAKLRGLGAKDGDTVRIRDVEVEYEDEDRWDTENDEEPQRRGRRTIT
jgi:GTP-binding protein